MNKGKYLSDILTSYESEEIIANRLKDFQLDEIGSKQFIQQHAYINKLNMQVIKNILNGGEEIIMTQFIDHGKLIPLIKELFTMNAFKTKVYPLIKRKIATLSSIKSYLVLYHEACVINLLENFFYSVTACQAADDFIVDIIEYCYNMITKYINYKMQHPNDEFETKKELTMKDIETQIKKIQTKDEVNEEDNEKELDMKYLEIDFNISMCCINILRYISDHLDQLGFPVRNHMMNVKDVPMLLVAIMELQPWQKKNKSGQIEIFENNNWIPQSDISNKLPKLEAQVWITIYNLFMVQENNKKYEINQYRQNQLLRLRKYFSNTLIDQIPQMENLKRSLEEMSLMTYGGALTVNPFIVELVPQLVNSKMFKLSEEEYKAIGEKVLKYFKVSERELKEELEPMNDVYNIDNMEYFMDDPKCANCGKDATNRCSRCKSEWYCSKECQIKRWKMHKELCKTLSELYKDDKETKEKKKALVQEVIPEKKEYVKEVTKEEKKEEKKEKVEEVKTNKELNDLD